MAARLPTLRFSARAATFNALRALRLVPALLAVVAAAAWAQPRVGLGGILGQRALLVVDDGPPKSVAVGETHQGVKLLAVQADRATIEVSGQRFSVRLGESPVAVGAGPAVAQGSRIVLPVNADGHVMAAGRINGRQTQFMLDSGATLVSMGRSEAARLGVSLDDARPVRLNTANGAVQGWMVRLSSVRVGEVEITEVEAVVVPQSLPFVLLGNSFLNRFQMQRLNDVMVLDRRF